MWMHRRHRGKKCGDPGRAPHGDRGHMVRCQGAPRVASKPAEVKGRTWKRVFPTALRNNQRCRHLELGLLASRAETAGAVHGAVLWPPSQTHTGSHSKATNLPTAHLGHQRPQPISQGKERTQSVSVRARWAWRDAWSH